MSKDEKTKIVAVIPAHLNSIRFPKKILYPFHNLPMVEHVRRRALLCDMISKVFVATCDVEIADQVRKHGGEVIMTSNKHLTGTTRVAEAIEQIDCTHVVLLQGDEPLLIPQHLDLIAKNIMKDYLTSAWNVTGPINEPQELDRHSFVKCVVTEQNRIIYCFRRNPRHSNIDEQRSYIRKILGIIAFRKSILLEIANLEPSRIEKTEFIEQMRIIENAYIFRSVPVDHSTPSVNEPNDIIAILETLKKDTQQAALLNKILLN